jgi:hypothetical protein
MGLKCGYALDDGALAGIVAEECDRAKGPSSQAERPVSIVLLFLHGLPRVERDPVRVRFGAVLLALMVVRSPVPHHDG